MLNYLTIRVERTFNGLRGNRKYEVNKTDGAREN